MLPSTLILYLRKMRGQQAHHVMQWPHVHGPGLGWCLAEGRIMGDEHRSMGHCGLGKTLLLLYLQYIYLLLESYTQYIQQQQLWRLLLLLLLNSKEKKQKTILNKQTMHATETITQY